MTHIPQEEEDTETSDSPPESSKKRAPPKSSALGKKGEGKQVPLDDDGKPIPPPPIFDSKGNEVPRPRDAQGNPLPIYVTPDGNPIFDDAGKPIPLKFGKDGKPIRLQVPGGGRAAADSCKREEGGTSNVPPQPAHPQAKKKRIPDWLFWVGPVNMALSTGIFIYLIIMIFQQKDADKEVDQLRRAQLRDGNKSSESISSTPVIHLAIAAAFQGLGIFLAALPMFAAKKDLAALFGVWFAFALIILGVHVYLCSVADNTKIHSIPAIYAAARFILCIVTACSIALSGSNSNIITSYYGGGAGVPVGGSTPQYYPGQGQPISTVPGGPSTAYAVQQQPVSVMYPATTMAYMPTYGMYGMGMGFGYGYPTNYGWGYGGYSGYGGYPYHCHHHGLWDDFWW